MAENEVHGTAIADLVSRQDAWTTRMERLENCLNTIVQDKNNTTENNRDLWDRMEQCSAHGQRLQERFHDLSDAESDRDIERQLAKHGTTS